MTREKMSRPNSSVPNGCAVDGASNWLVNACSMGSKGASAGANAAAATTPLTMIAPATKLECANSRRHERAARRRDVRRATVPAVALALGPDPRSQIAVDHVDQQAPHHQERRRLEDPARPHKAGPRQHAAAWPPGRPDAGK